MTFWLQLHSLMGTGATVGVPPPPAEGACAPLSRSQRADKWLLRQEALQALCGDMLGPHLGHGPCREPSAKAVPGPARFLFCTL